MSDDDILKAFARRLMERMQDRAETVSELEREVRREWAGARVYIKREPHNLKTRRQQESLAAGATLREAIELAGFSRSTYYRYFQKRLRRD